jgi:large subunit ribosomal protein L20
MPRAKTGFVRTRRHKKILKATKGFYLTRSKLFRRAHEAYIRSGEHAFAGRKLRKRDMKKLWIIRLNASLREKGISYSDFMHKYKSSNIILDRKILSELAVNKQEDFDMIVKTVTG